MDRSSILWIGSCILLILVACLAGCSDTPAPAETPAAAAPVTTPAGALYSAGDIVKNPKSSSGTALLIIGYDAAADTYERAYIYPNSDGSWGYRLDAKTDRIGRSVIEKVYTDKAGHVTVASVQIRAPTTEATQAVAVTTSAASSTVTATATATSALAPKIKGIDPDKGKTGTTVVITNLEGQNFLPGANVSLKKTGSNSIAASDVVVTSILITCKFAIPADAETGYWDLVVTNTDGKSHQYQNAFLVQQGTATPTTTTTSSAATSKVTITQIQDPLLVTGGAEGFKTVGILGTNLTAASGMRLTGPTTINAGTYTSSSATMATGFFTIPAGSVGTYYVKVVDAAGNVLATSTTTLTIQ